ncbi:hypothetical protein ACH436_05945 [Isoptericola sp. NPDC019693]|uniref:hypothetical protein n=1 Tax=Isoptericola sp. NPDC019693 TaxID=3364009 RepID=UPI0037A7AFBE
MALPDDIDAIRREPDPIRQAQRASALQTVYQQRSTELGRLRRAAMERAHLEAGLSYTDVAKALGITKGRVTQLRSSAPPAHRAIFGKGPVTVSVPYRRAEGRAHPLVSAEDMEARRQAVTMLRSLSFVTAEQEILVDDRRLPDGDVLLICGPKSSLVSQVLIDQDPVLDVLNDDGRWLIVRRDTGERFGSGSHDAVPAAEDLAYVSRRESDGRVITHVAGIHAVGSIGAVQHLDSQAAALFAKSGYGSFSMILRSSYDGMKITSTGTVAGPFGWE